MDNGERIYMGLMEREEMQKLEAENNPPHEELFYLEDARFTLDGLLERVMAVNQES